MKKLTVIGGNQLFGEIDIAPAKNACLPLIASSILYTEEIILLNAPKITDVETMACIIENLGGEYQFQLNGLRLNSSKVNKFEADSNLCSKARASFFIVGALLSRFKKAIVPLPGGCKIGKRPVDIHINVLKQLNAIVDVGADAISFNGEKMRSGKVIFPFPSVGATVNAICSAVFLKGESILINVAKEPEICDLCTFLNQCGCKIRGYGSKVIVIEGVDSLKKEKIYYKPIKDRIEAGTYMCACALCGGEITFKYDSNAYLLAVEEKLKEFGVNIYFDSGKITINSNARLKSVNLTADVYPFFPTDLQSPFATVCAGALGTSLIRDKVFLQRFGYLKELKKFGACVNIKKDYAIIHGKKRLHCATVEVEDLRGGAGLLIAGLKAEGKSELLNSDILDRGYENLVYKMNSIGAKIY